MGFVVEHNKDILSKTTPKRDNKALVYGKMSYMWKVGCMLSYFIYVVYLNNNNNNN